MSEAYLGEIRMFAGSYAPQNWLPCNGQLLAIQQYQALYTLIGTQYGGDGVNTFAVPNLQGVLPIGVGKGNGSAYTYTIGNTAGTYQASVAAPPAHSHALAASSNNASTASPAGAVFASAPSGFVQYAPSNAAGVTRPSLDPKLLGNTGGGQPHSNMMPSLALSFIICAAGMYPTSA